MKLTRTGTLVGTPYYMAPKQINSGKVDVPNRSHALGVILYQMCSGSFRLAAIRSGKCWSGTCKNRCHRCPPIRCSGDSGGNRPHFGQALAKAPEERYET